MVVSWLIKPLCYKASTTKRHSKTERVACQGPSASTAAAASGSGSGGSSSLPSLSYSGSGGRSASWSSQKPLPVAPRALPSLGCQQPCQWPQAFHRPVLWCAGRGMGCSRPMDHRPTCLLRDDGSSRACLPIWRWSEAWKRGRPLGGIKNRPSFSKLRGARASRCPTGRPTLALKAKQLDVGTRWHLHVWVSTTRVLEASATSAARTCCKAAADGIRLGQISKCF